MGCLVGMGPPMKSKNTQSPGPDRGAAKRGRATMSFRDFTDKKTGASHPISKAQLPRLRKSVRFALIRFDSVGFAMIQRWRLSPKHPPYGLINSDLPRSTPPRFALARTSRFIRQCFRSDCLEGSLPSSLSSFGKLVRFTRIYLDSHYRGCPTTPQRLSRNIKSVSRSP
jgi:hypothetical protein